jgi:hypothetical protein
MGAAIVIQPDGEITEVNLKPGVSHLPLMREHLNCQKVDVVALTDCLDMWIDDEGLFGQPVNLAATALARYFGCVSQRYHGPVLLCGVDAGGASIDLDAGQLRALITRLADVAEDL